MTDNQRQNLWPRERTEKTLASDLGTYNAATRFTTVQKTSVTMLNLHGVRRVTTAPSRTYGMRRLS